MIFTCFKSEHGPYEVPDGQHELVECPSCKRIRENGLCVWCEKHKATATFSEGTIAYIHGMSERVCRCCMLNKWRETLASLRLTVEKAEADVVVNPCR